MESGQSYQTEYWRIIKSPGFPGDLYYTLDNPRKNHYNNLAIGAWRSLVSRLVRVQEAPGSNPGAPTKKKVHLFGGLSFLQGWQGFEPLNANCPVDSCLPTARRRQLLNLLHWSKCSESRCSDPKKSTFSVGFLFLQGWQGFDQIKNGCFFHPFFICSALGFKRAALVSRRINSSCNPNSHVV